MQVLSLGVKNALLFLIFQNPLNLIEFAQKLVLNRLYEFKVNLI